MELPGNLVSKGSSARHFLGFEKRFNFVGDPFFRIAQQQNQFRQLVIIAIQVRHRNFEDFSQILGRGVGWFVLPGFIPADPGAGTSLVQANHDPQLVLRNPQASSGLPQAESEY